MAILTRDASDAEMVRALAANWRENRRSLAADPNVQITDAPDLFWFSTGLPRAWFNAVMYARLTPEEADARIDTIAAHFAALGMAWLWLITPDCAPADLGERLLARGWQHTWDCRNMALALPDAALTVTLPRDAEILSVTDETTRALWRELLRRENGEDDPIHAQTNALQIISADAPGKRHFVATLAGEPVARATVLLADGVAGLYGVETLATARGRGLGSAITCAALTYARDQGYEVAVLQASPMGFGVYQRLGFHELPIFPAYIWQPARD